MNTTSDSSIQLDHQAERNGTAPLERPIDTPILPPETPSPKPSRKVLVITLLIVGAIVTSLFGYRWWRFAATHQETDNAYVSGDINSISARITGTVIEVPIEDNQTVSSGTILVQLDRGDAEVNLQQAQAALAAAQNQASVAQANIAVVSTNSQGETIQAQGNIDAAAASVSTAESQVVEAQSGIPAAQAQLAQVEAALIKADLDYKRYDRLVKNGAIPQQQVDAAKATYDAALAQRDVANAQIQQVEAKLVQAQKNLTNTQAKLASTQGNLKQASVTGQQTEVSRRQYAAAQATIEQAKVQVKNAQLQLSYTQIKAPAKGQVGNKTVQVGQRVQPGQTLMSLVQQQPWIVANFKETQLGKMQPGQVVEIKLDAFSNHSFKGRIDSLSPASGAKFALLPPDNATGNFTKIVQRVPIKVTFDPESLRGYESKITSGMSAAVTVEVP